MQALIVAIMLLTGCGDTMIPVIATRVVDESSQTNRYYYITICSDDQNAPCNSYRVERDGSNATVY